MSGDDIVLDALATWQPVDPAAWVAALRVMRGIARGDQDMINDACSGLDADSAGAAFAEVARYVVAGWVQEGMDPERVIRRLMGEANQPRP